MYVKDELDSHGKLQLIQQHLVEITQQYLKKSFSISSNNATIVKFVSKCKRIVSKKRVVCVKTEKTPLA